jgi:hypothetical protein
MASVVTLSARRVRYHPRVAGARLDRPDRDAAPSARRDPLQRLKRAASRSDTLRGIWRSRRDAQRRFGYGLGWLIGHRGLQLRALSERHFVEPITIDPAAVRECSMHGIAKTFIRPGDWDETQVGPIETVRPLIVETMRLLFDEGVPWSETPQYRVMMHAVEEYQAGRVDRPSTIGAYWCRSPDDVERYFQALTSAIQSIRTHGYRTQAELRQRAPHSVNDVHDEVRVLIARDGRLILGGGGTHRLLIAQRLGLERIPARVAGVHERWALDVWERSSPARRATRAHIGMLREAIRSLSI